MNNIFLNLGPIKIYWYSILILISIILGLYLGEKEAQRNGLGKKFISDISLKLILFSILGARIYYVIFNIDYYKNNLLDIFKIWQGGLAIYGAVIGAIITIIIVSKKEKVEILRTTDTMAPYLILGQAIGRWGNFFNHEAYGPSTTLEFLESLHIPNFVIEGMKINGIYYQPTFLYESIWCFLGFILLIIIRKVYKNQHLGTLTGIYLIYYPIARFFIEILRTDSLYIYNIKVSMLVSIIMIIIGIILIITSKKRKKYVKSEEVYVNL